MLISKDLINARIIIATATDEATNIANVKAADEATNIARNMRVGTDKHWAAVVSAIHLYNKAGVWALR